MFANVTKLGLCAAVAAMASFAPAASADDANSSLPLAATVSPANRLPPEPSADETITSYTLPDGIRVTLQAPRRNDPAKPDHLILYLLPNGNTTEQAMGRPITPEVSFRYGSQQIAAQTRRVRKLLGNKDITTAYLEADTLSWPAWRSKRPGKDARIAEVVEEVRRKVAGEQKPGGHSTSATLTVDLVAHSGGGSFIWGFLNSRPAVPDYVQRIVFLDANYSYDDALHHGEKLLDWLHQSDYHRLIILAYDDREIELNGKRVVSDTGGTWRATDRMARFFEKSSKFNSGTLNDLQTSSALTGRLFMARHPNPENKILHSVLVERNGFVYGVAESRAVLDPGDLPFAGSTAGGENYRSLQ